MTDALRLLSDERGAFAAHLDGASREALDWRPSPRAWSLVLVLEHLVRAEEGTLSILDKQAAKGDSFRDFGAPDGAALARVLGRLHSDRRWQIPEPVVPALTPTGDVPLAGLRQTWGGFDGRWQALDEALSGPQRTGGIFRHVHAGPITAEGAARFTAAHVAHHRMQAERIRAADGFPG